jgi:hypothetical protein
MGEATRTFTGEGDTRSCLPVTVDGRHRDAGRLKRRVCPVVDASVVVLHTVRVHDHVGAVFRVVGDFTVFTFKVPVVAAVVRLPFLGRDGANRAAERVG